MSLFTTYFFFLFSFLSFIGFGQQTSIVDFLKAEATILPNKNTKTIKGSVTYTFKILQKTDSIYLDAIKMNITSVPQKGINTITTKDKIWFKGPFKKGEEYTFFLEYTATPKQTVYFTQEQIWTQGQGKYTSHWLPSLDDMNDKIEFDLTIIAPKERTVIANGKLVQIIEKEDQHTQWKFNMNHPMASYLVAFAIGNFNKTEVQSSSGVPIELYYSPTDIKKVEPTYRYTKQIFDFFEKEIGILYPWQNYKQVPVRDFLYAGMENTSCTLFSEAFIVDSIGFNDRNYVNVNAHEMAHQWFGNLITETSGTHHWLQEGFATYYALLAEKEVFGEEYYYWKLLQTAEQLEALSQEGKGESLLNPKASSLTFYEKGAWALHILKELIGEETFKKAVRNYLSNYQFKNVETSYFLSEVKAVSDIDISQWEKDWLHQTAFKAHQAFKSLTKSTFVSDFFAVSALRTESFDTKKDKLKRTLTLPNDYIGQEVIYQLSHEPIENTISLYKTAFASNNLFVRQAIALSLQGEIPLTLQTEYESLLKDRSYITQEAILPVLWRYFPKKRQHYLNELKEVEGFQNKNIRQLWLVLAINTSGYELKNRESYITELKNYTSPLYSFEIRKNALDYVWQLQLIDSTVLKNMINASTHHNWRFRKHARNITKEVLKVPKYKELLDQIAVNFTKKEQQTLLLLLK